MTGEEWDQHYWRVRQDYLNVGYDKAAASEITEQDMDAQFGPRPQETP